MSETDHNEEWSGLLLIALIIHLGQKETFDHSFNKSLSKVFYEPRSFLHSWEASVDQVPVSKPCGRERNLDETQVLCLMCQLERPSVEKNTVIDKVQE